MEGTAARLDELLANAGLGPLEAGLSGRFSEYYSLLIRWNRQINLTAIRDEDEILKRHFVESIACARALPAGICTLMDFGSGAGFPGICISLCRPEIAVTLAESRGRKSAFLMEAVRVVGGTAKVFAGRAEALGGEFDCVVMRAVDRMPLAVEQAGRLVRRGGWLAPLSTQAYLGIVTTAAGPEFTWSDPTILPGGQDRLLTFGLRSRCE